MKTKTQTTKKAKRRKETQKKNLSKKEPIQKMTKKNPLRMIKPPTTTKQRGTNKTQTPKATRNQTENPTMPSNNL